MNTPKIPDTMLRRGTLVWMDPATAWKADMIEDHGHLWMVLGVRDRDGTVTLKSLATTHECHSKNDGGLSVYLGVLDQWEAEEEGAEDDTPATAQPATVPWVWG